MTSPEVDASAKAREPDAAPRIRGLSPADAVAVVFIAGIVGAFLEPEWPVGVLLVAALGLVYGLFRVTRGLPMARRALMMLTALVVSLAIAAVLVRLGY